MSNNHYYIPIYVNNLSTAPKNNPNLIIHGHRLISSLQDGPKNIKTLELNGSIITSLKDGPQIYTELDISNTTLLKSLKHISKYVRSLKMEFSKITSLKYCPPDLKILNCKFSSIKSLEHCSPNIKTLNIVNTHITTLQHCPPHLHTLIMGSQTSTAQKINYLTAYQYLKSCHSIRVRGHIYYNEIQSLLRIPNLKSFIIDYYNISLDPFLPITSMSDIIKIMSFVKSKKPFF